MTFRKRVSGMMANLATVFSGVPMTSPRLSEIFGAPTTKAGQVVTESQAMSIAAVFAAVRLLSETMACLPASVYRQGGGGRRDPALTHPAYKLIHTAPNPEMNAKRFWELMVVYKLLWGNAYAEIQWDAGGNARALWPLEPWRVAPKRDADGVLCFGVTRRNGTQDTVYDADMLRNANFSWDGIVGQSTISHARESLGLTLGAETYGSEFFGSGGVPSGVLEHPGKLVEAARKQIRADWDSVHSPSAGGRNNKTAVLWEGMKYNKIGIPPEDAQFLDTRKFQVSEIARWFHVPAHMIGDLEHATFSNIEHQQIEFVVYSILPGVVEWEQEIDRKLLGAPGIYSKFNVLGLLRGDTTAQASFFREMSNIGVYCVNDILELLDENTIGPEGDQRFVPMNTVPLDKAADMATAKIKADSTPKPVPVAPVAPAEPAKPADQPKPAGLSEISDAADELLVESLARMIRKEATAARRASANHNKFLSWMDDFYPEHQQLIREAVERPLRCRLLLDYGKSEGVSSLCLKISETHVEQSRQELLTASECTPAEFTTKIEECVSRWERERLTLNLKEFLPCPVN